MAMDIKIDEIAAREFVQKAIFDSLSQDSRDALVQQAITALTLRPKKEYGYGTSTTPRSPLEEAFDRAVTSISYEVVREYLDDEEIKKSIQRQIFAALDEIVKNKGTWLYDQIGTAVGTRIAAVMGGDD